MEKNTKRSTNVSNKKSGTSNSKKKSNNGSNIQYSGKVTVKERKKKRKRRACSNFPQHYLSRLYIDSKDSLYICRVQKKHLLHSEKIKKENENHPPYP